MSDGSTTPEGFVQVQARKLLDEKIRVQAQIAHAFEAIDIDEKRLGEVSAAIHRAMQTEVAKAKRLSLKRAKLKMLFPALLLRPWRDKSAWLLLGGWALLVVFGVAYSARELHLYLYHRGMFDVLRHVPTLSQIAIVLLVGSAYVGLVLSGIRRGAKKSTQADFATLGEYASLQPALLALATEESGDPDFPYQSFCFPGFNGKTDDNYTVGKAYGPQFGAGFLAFGRAGRVYLLARFAANGFSEQTIPFGELKPDDPKVALLSAMAQRQARESQEHAPIIFEYARKCVDVLGVHARFKYLERRIETLENAERDWAEVALPQETLDSVLKLVDAFVSNRTPTPRGLLLYGPPGTGKTLIARKLAKNAGCNFVAANVADLKAAHIGETGKAVKQVWGQAREQAPTILFVDECESVFATRGSTNSDSFGADLVNTFLSEWDGFNQAAGKVFVIGATNRHDLIDNAVLSRFTAAIEIASPDGPGRKKILAAEFGRAGMKFDPSEAMVRETAGMSGRDLSTLVAKIAANTVGDSLSADDFLHEVRKSRGKGATDVQVLSWDDVILPEATKQAFRSLGRELIYAEEMRKLGVSVPRGILLYGPPGTGKTQIARVLANESGLSFLAASSSDLKAAYTGQSGGKVKQLFEKARALAPCILFIDEIDAVARQRGGGDSFTEEIVAQLLQELDGVATRNGQVFLLAASNRVDSIDSALLSRLERKIPIDLPDEGARAAILRLQLASKPLAFDLEEACAGMAQRTEGRSGRDLQSLITTATQSAVRRAMAETGDPRHLKLTLADLESAV